MAVNAYIAEIQLFAGYFAFRGTTECAGQLMPIAQNTALFSLLGTQYGGDGESTFAVPDLTGGFPVGSPDGYPAGASSVTASSGGDVPMVGIRYLLTLQGVYPPRA